MLTVAVTIVFHYLPWRFFKSTRVLWGWLALEQKIKYAWDFIENRNDVESMYRNNYVAFCLMWYIETNSNLTAAIVEGLLYGTLPLLSLPRLIFTNTCEYIYSFAMMLLMQVLLMGSSI